MIPLYFLRTNRFFSDLFFILLLLTVILQLRNIFNDAPAHLFSKVIKPENSLLRVVSKNTLSAAPTLPSNKFSTDSSSAESNSSSNVYYRPKSALWYRLNHNNSNPTTFSSLSKLREHVLSRLKFQLRNALAHNSIKFNREDNRNSLRNQQVGHQNRPEIIQIAKLFQNCRKVLHKSPKLFSRSLTAQSVDLSTRSSNFLAENLQHQSNGKKPFLLDLNELPPIESPEFPNEITEYYPTVTSTETSVKIANEKVPSDAESQGPKNGMSQVTLQEIPQVHKKYKSRNINEIEYVLDTKTTEEQNGSVLGGGESNYVKELLNKRRKKSKDSESQMIEFGNVPKKTTVLDLSSSSQRFQKAASTYSVNFGSFKEIKRQKTKQLKSLSDQNKKEDGKTGSDWRVGDETVKKDFSNKRKNLSEGSENQIIDSEDERPRSIVLALSSSSQAIRKLPANIFDSKLDKIINGKWRDIDLNNLAHFNDKIGFYTTDVFIKSVESKLKESIRLRREIGNSLESGSKKKINQLSNLRDTFFTGKRNNLETKQYILYFFETIRTMRSELHPDSYLEIGFDADYRKRIQYVMELQSSMQNVEFLLDEHFHETFKKFSESYSQKLALQFTRQKGSKTVPARYERRVEALKAAYKVLTPFKEKNKNEANYELKYLLGELYCVWGELLGLRPRNDPGGIFPKVNDNIFHNFQSLETVKKALELSDSVIMQINLVKALFSIWFIGSQGIKPVHCQQIFRESELGFGFFKFFESYATVEWIQKFGDKFIVNEVKAKRSQRKRKSVWRDGLFKEGDGS
ncbi:expressed protein [Phakopsora pachyrhizi]|uniref:Expressed protein n=1 Tax=Phakopsora pachyrhizi TaxID=170000 RepID=A0AAV0BLF5_PHAPC|nr:expressed protein [Phakopsora pachyrhizi]